MDASAGEHALVPQGAARVAARAPAADVAVSPDPTAEDALKDYLALGPGRTLAELARTTGLPASTLGRWAKTGEWTALARDHDRQQRQAIREAERAEKDKERRKRESDQLKVALLLRGKAFSYLRERELEGVIDEPTKTVLVKGCDPSKAQVALAFLKEARDIERSVLGSNVDRDDDEGTAFRLTPDMLRLSVEKAIIMKNEITLERGLPSPDDPDPLGDIGL
jgi:hypothetical protein